jgi:quercetin dioxygenase-like cupin family protein
MAVASVLASLVIFGGAKTDRDVVGAQGRTAIMVTRIFTGPDGLSHAEEIEMPRTAAGTYEMLKVTGVQFSSRAPSTDGDWHTGPRRQYVITLQGRGELEVANGQKVPVGPGHINLIEDTTGKGHITRNFGPDNRIVLTIPLEDQTIGGRR